MLLFNLGESSIKWFNFILKTSKALVTCDYLHCSNHLVGQYVFNMPRESMGVGKLIGFLMILVLLPLMTAAPVENRDQHFRDHHIRHKRQFDFSISAEHADEEGTDIFAEATARLWESQDGNTRVDGSAKVTHHSGPFSSFGKTKYSGSLHFHSEKLFF